MHPHVTPRSRTTHPSRVTARRSLFGTALALLATCALLAGDNAQAAEMTQSEFLALVGGEYTAVRPSPETLLNFKEAPPRIRIYEEGGTLLLENELFVITKASPAYYRITQFECYTHAPTSTTCEFSLALLDEGRFVHFLGVNSVVRVTRHGPLTLTIQPRYSIAGAFEVDPIIVTKKQ